MRDLRKLIWKTLTRFDRRVGKLAFFTNANITFTSTSDTTDFFVHCAASGYLSLLKLVHGYLALSQLTNFKKNEVSAVNQYRELFVNNIISNGFAPLKPNEIVSRDSSLLKAKYPAMPDFWDNYNFLSNIPLKQ